MLAQNSIVNVVQGWVTLRVKRERASHGTRDSNGPPIINIRDDPVERGKETCLSRKTSHNQRCTRQGLVKSEGTSHGARDSNGPPIVINCDTPIKRG